jgi:hypothetical protein
MSLGRSLAAAAVAALAAAPAASFAQTPISVVQALYAEPALSVDSPAAHSVFAADLDAALKADSTPGEVGAIDFDYRYGAQDTRISGLQLLEEVDGNLAKVVAVFKNFGRPESVDWLLCRRSSGEWRIADASSNTDRDSPPWDLRDLLKLPRDRVRC